MAHPHVHQGILECATHLRLLPLPLGTLLRLPSLLSGLRCIFHLRNTHEQAGSGFCHAKGRALHAAPSLAQTAEHSRHALAMAAHARITCRVRWKQEGTCRSVWTNSRTRSWQQTLLSSLMCGTCLQQCATPTSCCRRTSLWRRSAISVCMAPVSAPLVSGPSRTSWSSTAWLSASSTTASRCSRLAAACAWTDARMP